LKRTRESATPRSELFQCWHYAALLKLWRDGSGGYFTVSLENYGGHHPQYFLQFLCIKNDTEKDPSDQC